MTEGAPAILVENLHKRFGDLNAVDGISFTVERGEIFGLLGPNGAGKTTTLSMLSGLLKADGGAARIAGHPAGSLAARVALGIAPQEIALYEELDGRENLAFFGALYGLRGKTLEARADDVLRSVGLTDRAGERVGKYSGGMKRRLNLAAALLHDPAVLLLDEPTAGVDPQSRAHLFETVQTMAARGKTIIYTTHYMEEAEKLCRRIAIMDRGKILVSGTLAELLAQLEQEQVHRFRFPPEDAGKAAGALGQTASRREDAEAGEAVVEAPGRGEDLPARLEALIGAGVHPLSVEVDRPNLEALFLQLTGRTLRD